MVSIHQKIFDDIERKIMAGVWQPGLRIPPEHELEEMYGCSRMTVNKALSVLAGRGMIIRRRRAGTFVAPPQIDRTVMDIQDIGVEAQNAGHLHTYEILSRKVERLDKVESDRVGIPPGAEVLRVECLHFVDSTPNALERRIIMLDLVPRARFESFEAKPPASWLLDQIPWSEAKHVIRAVPADATVARLLKIDRGEACLSLTRQTWQNQRTVTHVQIIHPGDRYQFAGVFKPSTV
ncbi:histidine utilization repressor [Agrobacterium rhizogenes]|nr:histidine utilization repressor [Rhizobium rhizogenes]NTH62051.1 histidine utilization repressor [Rhizobium rhizogenes]NTH93677.1 histidine utilization repressor [Rhizobium rhizogenes]